ncbi:MAG TPA: DUF922 domain-containing protein [Chitinophagaceae bacterium]|nr:DUF922 domain-containing protein [Chitinophagaceae bacterium]
MRTSLFFFLLLPFVSLSQEGDDELIQWKAGHRLKWDDYQAKPKPGVDAAASTATFLAIEYNFENNAFGYKISCSFSRKKSWAQHKNDYILAHEQGHFDIAEIYARLLNKRMKDYKFDKTTYKTELGKIYHSVLDEKEAFQNSYDDETNHSINKDKQAAWLKKIDGLLAETAPYRNY